MTSFGARPLDEAAWPDFAQLVERHRGVWGGCWCMAFHPDGVGHRRTLARQRLVRLGRLLRPAPAGQLDGA